MTTVYDGTIKKACALYLPGADWRLVRAQLVAESRLNPKAVSPSGAIGIAQFMPATWIEVALALDFPQVAKTAHDPNLAIAGCCYYMSRLIGYWTSPRPAIDRYCLALASYNAGMGNLTKAQKVSGGKLLYCDIIKHLEAVTGRHSRETIVYVERILKFYNSHITKG